MTSPQEPPEEQTQLEKWEFVRRESELSKKRYEGKRQQRNENAKKMREDDDQKEHLESERQRRANLPDETDVAAVTRVTCIDVFVDDDSGYKCFGKTERILNNYYLVDSLRYVVYSPLNFADVARGPEYSRNAF